MEDLVSVIDGSRTTQGRNGHLIPAEILRKRISIVKVLASYGVVVASGSETQIRCPWHDDRTPSARVYPDSNDISCFTCRKRFDVIDLFRRFEGDKRGRVIGFGEAISMLSEQYGIYSEDGSVEESTLRLKQALSRDRTDLSRILELVFIDWYQKNVPQWWKNEIVTKQLRLIDAGMQLDEKWLESIKKELAP